MTLARILQFSARKQIAALESGFPAAWLQVSAKSVGLAHRKIADDLLLVGRRRGRFTPTESERLLRLAICRKRLRSLFTTDKAVGEWLPPHRSVESRDSFKPSCDRHWG
jgi:hypothetical protein